MSNMMFSAEEVDSISGGRRPPAPRDYRLPEIFPSLSKAKRISLDLESVDKSIGDGYGPGWRRDAYIVGFGLGIGDRKGNIEFCVAPDTKVLTANLEWKSCSALILDEELVGFDENKPVGWHAQRKYRASRITSITRLKRPCVRIITDQGSVVCSVEHKWLCQYRPSGLSYYRESGTIAPGHVISFLQSPWEQDDSREAGYIAGIFDGEATVDTYRIMFAQNKGAVLERVKTALAERGFSISNDYRHGVSNCVIFDLIGGRPEVLRFLGTIRPTRLLRNARSCWENRATNGRGGKRATVLAVEQVGEQEVIALGTTTKTFIANGFLSHNSEYYPCRHKGVQNLDADKVYNWLSDELAFFTGEIVGANLLYDFDGFQYQRVFAPLAKFRDIQWAAALLDENSFSYKLDALAKQYGFGGKVKDELKLLYGDDFIKRFHEVHPGHARTYGIGDIELPLKILHEQEKVLRRENLEDLFDLESRLLPMLIYMRRLGVRVNLEQAQKMNWKLIEARDRNIAKIAELSGVGTDYDNFGKPSIMKAIFDKLQIKYPYLLKGADGKEKLAYYGDTEEKHSEYEAAKLTGKPSFRKVWLESLEEEGDESNIGTLIKNANIAEKARGTFVDGYITDNAIGDRVHCEFHPLRKKKDENSKSQGTITGRFSGSNPNLQNIPTRDAWIGPMCREMFIADEGAQWWSLDYSQIEYRMLVHFAVEAKCTGAEIPQAMYLKNPMTDFHDACAMMMYRKEWDAAVAAWGAGTITKEQMKSIHKKLRKPAKNLNFGMCLSPEMRLLKTDLTWDAAINTKVGDHVVGFDEERIGGHSRRYRDAVVERVDVLELPCIKITTDKGEYTCSEEHLWLARAQRGMKKKHGGRSVKSKYCLNWIPTSELMPGHKIPVLCKPWKSEEGRDAGWLSGIFDGEGHLSVIHGYHSQLGMSQNEGLVLSNTQRLLNELSFKTVMDDKGNCAKCRSLRILGGRGEHLRFLGSIRPLRLLAKARSLWEGAACWCGDGEHETVLKIESVGIKQVVSIRTSTRTFIAEGLLSHNCYGMGAPLLAEQLHETNQDGSPNENALQIMKDYHEAAPYIRELNKICVSEAEKQQFITTILNRRGRFNLWEPRFRDKGTPFVTAKPYEEALALWGSKIKVVGTHKAMNKKLQGSAADLMKLAMVQAWEGGVFDDGNDLTCVLTVHDELNGSIWPGERGEKALAELKHIMETCLPLHIPVMASGSRGRNWSEAK